MCRSSTRRATAGVCCCPSRIIGMLRRRRLTSSHSDLRAVHSITASRPVYLGATEVTMAPEELLRKAYVAFNARDIDGALALMHADVAWPNGMEGGTVRP